MTGGGTILGVERSITGRRWKARAEDDRLAQALAQRLDVPEIVGRILAGRGVPLDEAERFLQPSLRNWLPDPSVLLDMDRGAARVAAAVMADETIAIFGDYDVDGATSSALLHRFLRAVGRAPIIYIPDRIREGYGPNAPALKSLADRGAKVVIAVDCGTLAYAPLQAARDYGLDVVVIDHHLAEPALPPALAVVNPNRLDQDKGLGQLAAVGVAFLLVVAVNRALRAAGWYATREEPDLRRWLDLVAVGTICDVVPLTGVNRALVTYGLKVLGERSNIGLAALADVAGLNEPAGCYHCGFLLGPRINAGGRVGRSDLGAQILATEDRAEAAAIAAELHALNRERQNVEAEVLTAARAEAERTGVAGPLVMVAGNDWHPGVIGIVAGRLREAFDRPAIAIAFDRNGLGKGSGRSVPGADLGSAVTAALQAGLLVNGGGHAMAAGLTLRRERLDEVREFLAARLLAQVALDATPTLGLDGALAVPGATPQLLDLLDRAGPYGSGNAEPRFALPAVRVIKAEIKGEKHVRCLLSGSAGQGRLSAIAFRSVEGPLGPALLRAQGGEPIHLAGHLRGSWYRGERRVELTIEDAAQAA